MCYISKRLLSQFDNIKDWDETGPGQRDQLWDVMSQ